MNREEMLNRVRNRDRPWDIIVIGGGASGAGCALDAAARGFDVLLLEQSDFGKGTSSRSTKLIHGGVRYLARGDIGLVREALRERGILLRNAPQFVRRQSFIVPCYSRWQKFYYGVGLKLYDLLAGNYGFGRSRLLSARETAARLPTIKKERLAGGVIYYDGQFDDAALLFALLKTAAVCGAALLNYARVVSLSHNSLGEIAGLRFEDALTGEVRTAAARVVINATGAFADRIRRMSRPQAAEMITPSQGIHLVFDRTFLGGEDALMIPKTTDGRVLFAIPWQGGTIVGTTDTPVAEAGLEPRPLAGEIEFILQNCGEYLTRPPVREDIRSVFAGIRPLVGRAGDSGNTARLSRGHTIEVDEAGLITLTGGKWTTYRNMAEDAVDRALETAGLPFIPCVTKDLPIGDRREEDIAGLITENPELAGRLHPDYPDRRAAVVSALRNEMAETLEDVLARRLRLVFLDAAAALAAAPETARIIAAEKDRDEEWITGQLEEFRKTARRYQI